MFFVMHSIRRSFGFTGSRVLLLTLILQPTTTLLTFPKHHHPLPLHFAGSFTPLPPPITVSCKSFLQQGHFQENHTNHNYRPTKQLSARNEPNCDTNKESSNDVQRNLQLWLDLRQTSIAPLAALLHLTNDLWDEFSIPSNKSENSFIVNKVVIDHKNFFHSQSVVEDIREEFEMDIGILVVKDDQLLEIDQDGNMQPFGELIMVGQNSESGSMTHIRDVDPLSVLDGVSKREWVLLDVLEEHLSNGSGGGGSGTEAIFNMLELVSNGVKFVASMNLVDGSIDMDEDGTKNDKQVVLLPSGRSAGGIGITCSSPSSVMEMAAIIQSLSPGSKGYKTTQSGILVQSVEGASSSSIGTRKEESSNSPMVNYAIVMPFDVSLWKTASFLSSASI